MINEKIDFVKETTSIVNCFGCLTEEQILTFFPQNDYVREKVKNCIFYQNTRTKQFRVMDGYITRAEKPRYDEAMIDCLWALFAHLKTTENPEQIEMFHHFCTSAAFPFSINCVVDRRKICHFAYLSEADNPTPILTAREMVYSKGEVRVGKENKTPTNLIFVSRYEDVLDTIADCNLAVPHKIAILSGEKFKQPNIDFYEKE